MIRRILAALALLGTLASGASGETLVDFENSVTDPPSTVNTWNVLPGAPSAPFSLLDSTGAPAGITLWFPNPPASTSTSTDNDPWTDSAVPWLASEATRDFYYYGSGQGTVLMEIGGLGDYPAYTVELVSCRDNSSLGTVEFQAVGDAASGWTSFQPYDDVYLPSADPAHSTLKWTGIAPAANGTITVQTRVLSSQWGYMNALSIRQAPIAVTTANFSNQLDAQGRMNANTDYHLRELSAGGQDYFVVEAGTSEDATSSAFVFGTYENNDGGQYSDFSGSVSGTNLAFGLGNMESGTWQFSESLENYEGFAFFELIGQEAVTLSLIDAAGDAVGNFTLTSDAYGPTLAKSPPGGWYRPTAGSTQFSDGQGPVGTFFTLDAFTGLGDLSTATGFRLEGASGIDPFGLVALARVPEPSTGLLAIVGLGLLTIIRRRR